MVENGQVAPSKSSDVDNFIDSSWDSEEWPDTPTMELEARVYASPDCHMVTPDCHMFTRDCSRCLF